MKTKTTLLILIIGLFLFTTNFSYAQNSLQSWMEKKYLQHQSKKLLKDQVKASDKGSDLHNTSVEIARQHALVGIHSSIKQIIQDFRFSQPNCALSYDDASVLLVQNKQFKRFLNRMKEVDSDFTYKLDNTTFAAACVRYLNCKNTVPKKGNTLSTDEYSQCTQDIADKFTSTMAHIVDANQLSNYSFGDEIFDNGTLEDSSFDISYDLEQIHKILFANPKRIPSYYLWGPPSYLSKNSNNLNPQVDSIAKLIPTKLFAANSIKAPNIEEAITQINSRSAQEAESSITSNLQCFDPQPIIQSEDGKVFKEEIQKLNQTTLSLQEEELLDDVIGTVSQPYFDEPPTPTPITLPPEIINPLLIEERGGGSGPSPENNTSNNQNTGSCPIGESNIGEQNDLSADKANIISCLKKCSTCEEGFFKKACYQSCLCSKSVNDVVDKDFFGLTLGTKLCLVASTTPDIITPGTQVVSIQEIINQLAATIGKLKESGQYIPSSKPSEFFSPTTKIGKLGNLLNFKINLTSATKYDKPNNQNTVAKTQEYYNNQIPDAAQLQINAIISQQEGYGKLLDTHISFRNTMNTILTSFRDAMKSFKAVQDGSSKQ